MSPLTSGQEEEFVECWSNSFWLVYLTSLDLPINVLCYHFLLINNSRTIYVSRVVYDYPCSDCIRESWIQAHDF